MVDYFRAQGKVRHDNDDYLKCLNKVQGNDL